MASTSLSPRVSSQDQAYELRARQLMKTIQSFEEEEAFLPLKPVQDFFDTMEKIQNINLKDSLFVTALMDFSQKPNVQWIAFKIATEKVPLKKTSCLSHLITECKETNSREMAFKAAEHLDMEPHKKKHLIQNLTEYFKGN